MSGYICTCGHDKGYHAVPATGGMYDGTGYGKCLTDNCNCEGFMKTKTGPTGSDGYKFAPTYEEFQNLEKRVQVLEGQNCANQIKEILGELFSWAYEYEHNILRYRQDTAAKSDAALVAEFRQKITGIQKRYGIG